MAKSIRVSDELYELAAEAGDVLNRSLAEQVEHWIRLGAALDAAGLTMEQTLLLLQGDSFVKEKMLSHLIATSSDSRRRRSYTGAPSIAKRNAELDRQVESGERSPESLFLLSRAQVKKAKFTQSAPAKRGTGW